MQIEVTKTIRYLITPDCPDYDEQTLCGSEETIEVEPRPCGLYEDWTYELISEDSEITFIGR